jgi:hypothetical protein
MDTYLASIDVIAADRLQLDLRRSTVLDAPVIRITPKPVGAPDAWVDVYDRFDRVQSRYDIPTPDGGISHVMPSAPVMEALRAIKTLPGRLVASDAARAFLHNPYGVLGDGATEALPPEEFERSREAAGIRFKSLEAGESSDAEFACRLIDRSGEEADQDLRLRASEAMRLRDKAYQSSHRNLPLFSWEGEEIELTSDTQSTLESLNRWLGARTLANARLRYAEVFDLTGYSDRVVGFDGTITAVPYVARKQGDRGWFPDNIETGIVIQENGAAPPRHLPLSPEQLTELASSVAHAQSTGEARVPLPDTGMTVPVAEAAQWVQAFSAHQAASECRVRHPSLVKDPKAPSERPILRILHNIESLDYGGKAPGSPGSKEDSAELPNTLKLNAKLLAHQREGLAWLQRRYRQQALGVTGCLLADDMGLGKTLQALCLIAWRIDHEKSPKPSLVIAPVSLLDNWRAEIRKFFDDSRIKVLALYGSALGAARLPQSEIEVELIDIGLKKFLRPGFEKGHVIVLTTYETLRDFEFSLARVDWGVVVCDEAQKIKNPVTLLTRAAKALRGDFKIACTGTPVENSLADLWCLFDFFQPGLLGSLNEFTRTFRRAIETRAAGHEALIEKLRKAINPWVLRRMKTEVAELPPKYERTHPQSSPEHMVLPMSPLQKHLYGQAIQEFRAAMKREDARGAMLAMLHRLRTICSNPAAVADTQPEAIPIEKHLEDSPKLAWVMKQLGAVKSRGEKAIIFTEFREIQRLVQRAIASRWGLHASIINGDTSVNPEREVSRQRLIDVFQAQPGFHVIILSTTAIGFGVNIQAANHVFHFTRPWNPAKEDQATDRAYRIGQNRAVYVYCPTVVAPGYESFDQRIDALLAGKRALSRDMLSGSQELKIDDFKDL